MRKGLLYGISILLSTCLFVVNSNAQITSYPYSETFDTYPNCTPYGSNTFCAIGGGWFNDAGTANWLVGTGISGATSSFNTGPGQGTGANSAIDNSVGNNTGSFLFVETSGAGSNKTAILRGPQFDLTSLAAPKFSFYYHMYGATMGDVFFEVSTNGGGSWTIESTLAGQQQTGYAISDAWREEVVDLTAYAGMTIDVRFRGETGTSFTSDMALDDFSVFEPQPIDVSADALVNPVDTGCSAASEFVSVQISNAGADTIFLNNDSVRVTVDVSGTISAMFDTTLTTGMLVPGQSAIITFGNPINTSVQGLYSFMITATTANDSVFANDTLYDFVFIIPPVATFPYLEDFETFLIGFPGTLNNGWEYGNTTGFRWQVDNNGTPSNPTGPLVDNTTGTAFGIYMYTEASTGLTGDEAELMTPCLDFTSLANPHMQFAYHMFGSQMGALNVDVLSGGSWTTVHTIIGQQQTSQTDPWLNDLVDLSAYGGQIVKVRFRGVRGIGLLGDMAIDDVRFFEPAPVDFAPISLNSPLDTGCVPSIQNLNISIRNSGTDTLDLSVDSVQVQVIVSGASSSNFDTLINSGMFNTGDTMDIDFGNVNIAGFGSHDFTIITTSFNDGDATNDTMVVSIFNNVVSSFPYLEDFETFTVSTNATGLNNGWTTNPSGTTTAFRWTPDAGGTPSFATGPTIDHTLGTFAGVYMYTESSNGFNGSIAEFESPCLDISSMGCPSLEFWYHMHGATMGTLHIDVQSGGVWTNDVHVITGQQHLNQTDPWLQSPSIDLSAFSGTVKVRFRAERGTSFTGDMAIDDIRFFDNSLPNIALTELISPATGCGLTTDSIRLQVENLACTPISNIPLQMIFNGSLILLDTITDPIPGFGTTVFVFDTTVDVSTLGTYTYIVTATVPGDVDPSNNFLQDSLESRFLADDPMVWNDTSCGFDSVELVAQSNGDLIVWFTDSMGQNMVSTEDTFVTPYLTDFTTYYAAAVTGGTANVGAVDPGIGAGGNYTFFPDGLVFDVETDMVINTVTVYPNAAGDVVVNLRDNGGILLQTTTVAVPGPGAQTIPVGFSVSPGIGYQLDAIGTTTGGLFRNTSGAIYPYTLPDVVSITGAINGLVNSYYFFYDWEITYIECISNLVPVEAIIYGLPTIELGQDTVICDNQDYFLDPGLANKTYSWSTGDTTQTILTSITDVYAVTVTDSTGCNVADSIDILVNALPMVDFGPDTVACDGRILDAGNTSATFNWNTGHITQSIDVTVDGNYWVMITDTNGCINGDTVLLDVRESPEVDLGNDVTQCGGFVILDALNPTSTYLWNDNSMNQTLTATTSDTYWVSVTDLFGCVGGDTVDITIHALPHVFLGPDQTVCNTVVNLDAGNPGSSYNWSNAMSSQIVSVSSSGNYAVTVTTTNGCTATDDVNITVDLNKPTVNIFTDTVGCGSVTLDAGNQPVGVSYLWSNGASTQMITATQTGTYWVEVSNTCGNDITSANVIVDNPPNAAFDTTIVGQDATFTNTTTNGGGSTTYHWTFGDGNDQSSSDVTTAPLHSYDFGGVYTVTLIAENSCGTSTTTMDIMINGPGVGLEDINFADFIHLYPNPTTDVLQLELRLLEASELDITMVDATGRLVYSETLASQGLEVRHQMDLERLAEGIYSIIITDGNETINYQVVKQ